MPSLEELGAESVVAGIDIVDSRLHRRFAVPGEIGDCLAGLGPKGFQAFAKVDRVAELDDASPLSCRGKGQGVNVLTQAGDRFSDPIKRRLGSHVSSLITENPKGKNRLIGPEGGGGVVDLPVWVNANAMNGRPDPANSVRETGSGFALDLNFLLQRVNDLLGGIVDLFVYRGGLLTGAVAALSEESLESGGADPEKFKPEVGLGIEFRFESAGKLVERTSKLVPDVFDIGELHGDRDGVDRMALAQFFLCAERDVGGSLGEGRNFIVTEIDISFRKEDEGVLAFNKNIGRTLHGFAIASFAVDAEGSAALHDP